MNFNIWYIVIGVVVLLLLWVILTFNSFVKGKNRVDEAFSTMDVYMKKRYDLIPNLVETIKGYITHEKETLEAVISARSKAINSNSVEEQADAERNLGGVLGRLLAISENYPDLKANVSFLDLQGQLKNIEGEIASSRKYYNAVVKEFNIKVESVPSNIIAMLFKFAKRPLFEVGSDAERENVTVTF